MESPGSSPGLEKLRRASLPSSPPALSLDPTSLLRRDALLSPQHLQTLRQEQEEDSAGKLSVTEDEDFLGESVKEYSVEEFKEMETESQDWSEQVEDEVSDPTSLVWRDALLSPPLRKEEQEEGRDTQEVSEDIDIEEEVDRGDIEEAVLVDKNAKVSKPDTEEVSVTEEVKGLMVAHLDLAQTKSNWFMNYKRITKTENVCDLCEKGKEDFKYGAFETYDQIKALEDLTEKLYKWKRPGQAYGLERDYEENFDSMVDQRRIAIGYHGLDVEPF